jgi:hypothetical protein
VPSSVEENFIKLGQTALELRELIMVSGLQILGGL